MSKQRRQTTHKFLGADDTPTDFSEDVWRRARERKATDMLGEMLMRAGAMPGVHTQPQTVQPRRILATDTGLCSDGRWALPPAVFWERR